MEKIHDEIEQIEKNYRDLFTVDFINKMDTFFFNSENIKDVANAGNSDFLFKRFDEEKRIKPIYEYRERETKAEKTRPGRNALDTYGVYHFYYPNCMFSKPAEIIVTRTKKTMPSEFEHIPEAKYFVDVEFFEKNRLVDDSKNTELKEYLTFYSENEGCDLKDLEHLMSLRDVEKIHLKFLFFSDKLYIPAFIGIGTNEVFSIREKDKERRIDSKTRYYKYDLEKCTEQKISIKEVGDYISFDEFSVIFPEKVTLTDEYALDPSRGVIKKCGKGWKKIKFNVVNSSVTLKDELVNPKNLRNILENLFPDFERYKYIAYDPLEKVLSYGHEKTIRHLMKNEVLGEGFQSKLNVASDLYLNSYDSVFRIKMISVLLYNFIDSGELDRIIQDIVDEKESMPMKN